MTATERTSQRPRTVSARVLGCLRPGTVSFVHSCDEEGLPGTGTLIRADLQLVPTNLQLPGSRVELLVVNSQDTEKVVGVSEHNRSRPHIRD
jgi:hypothetical protein